MPRNTPPATPKPGDDWLVGGDRRVAAAERIYAAAAVLIARHGLDGFSIDMIADEIHCSRATIYRYAGGKTEIRDAVVTRAATRILDTVRVRIRDLRGSQRVITAIMLALKLIRADPLGRLMIGSIGDAQSGSWITGSAVVDGFAAEMIGCTEPDPTAAQWLIRVFMSMLLWPGDNADAEYQILQRFFAPAFSVMDN